MIASYLIQLVLFYMAVQPFIQSPVANFFGQVKGFKEGTGYAQSF